MRSSGQVLAVIGQGRAQYTMELEPGARSPTIEARRAYVYFWPIMCVQGDPPP